MDVENKLAEISEFFKELEHSEELSSVLEKIDTKMKLYSPLYQLVIGVLINNNKHE